MPHTPESTIRADYSAHTADVQEAPRLLGNVTLIAAIRLSHTTGVQGQSERVDVTVAAVVAGLLAEVVACNPPALHRRKADGYKGQAQYQGR